jgi:ABC-type multidrug transport system permease subunit
MNPVLIGAGMVSFCGVVVPYDAMQPFWKYWLYYLDPFHYLFGGLMGPIIWDVKVECRPEEFTSFNVPDGQTCGEYVADFLSANAGYVASPNATGSCDYCAYSTGAEYAKTFNLREEYYGWRDVSWLAL